MKEYIKCKVCGSCINVDTKSQYIECACGAVAVDGNEHYIRVIGDVKNWEHVKEKNA